ncbi:carbohydrate-binding protein [Kribbella sancticallisti]|uniref:carbohydrate-binding protein n=1 Tax=Kribbella sancticallisti TaxID=460087 RepID=UPI0031D92209
MGNHPLVNGRETEDRAELELPAGQDRLVRAVHAANSKTVTDTRLTAAFDVHGERIPAREIYSAPLDATAFDEYCAITLADASPERGDAVRSLESGAWLVFEDVDLADGAGHCVASVASDQGAGTIELRLDDPLHGPVLGTVQVPSTGHRHTWTESSTPLAEARGVHALYAVFSNEALSLQSLSFERRP